MEKELSNIFCPSPFDHTFGCHQGSCVCVDSLSFYCFNYLLGFVLKLERFQCFVLKRSEERFTNRVNDFIH